MDAIDKEKYDSMTDFELVDELSRIANVAVPQAIEDIRTAPVLHDRVCDRTQMEETVKNILGVQTLTFICDNIVHRFAIAYNTLNNI